MLMEFKLKWIKHSFSVIYINKKFEIKAKYILYGLNSIKYIFKSRDTFTRT